MKIYDNPLVSVIVPVYNVEKYVGRCVDSLLNQTLSNIEIILVDDGSTDSSGGICDGYAAKDTRIKVIHQANRGLGLSRNSGIEIATGEYIGFVDSDDCVSTEMFRILYENASRFVADISYCSYLKFQNENEIKQKREISNCTEVWEGKKEIREYMLDRVGLPPRKKEDCRFGASVCCGIFSSKIIRTLNARFVSERQLIAEDMVFDIDVIPYCNKIVHTNAELYYYRHNPNSLTTRYVADRFERNVSLCHAMESRLAGIYGPDIYKESLNRYFLKITRVSLMEEIAHIKENGWGTARENISRIANNRELEDIMASYPIKLLPFAQRVFFFALKQKMYLLTAILIKINMTLKKSR